MMTRVRLAFLAASLSFFVVHAASGSGSISLAWDANPESDIAGYLILYGTSSGAYPNTVDVHNVTTTTVSNLTTGTRYYFVAKAYNTAGLESPPSIEVSGIAGENGEGDIPAGKELVNVSTRVRVYKNDSVMIGGFIIGGDVAKPVAIRAIGPSLLNLGVKGALADPILEVYNSSGAIYHEER